MSSKPFRWSLAKREQLGGLVDNLAPEDLEKDSFLEDLRTSAARILALADDADLAFIGRTPENFFDYLSGIFQDVHEAPQLHLVQFSLRWAGPGGVRSLEPHKLSAYFEYLTEEGVDPASIATGKRSLALVDYIALGVTMYNFVELLRLLSEHYGVDWNAVQRKLRIIGLRTRTHNSPNTWRWQQNQDWLEVIPDAVIKNVSVPGRLLHYIANDQPKITDSFHPGRWETPSERRSNITLEQRQALAFGVALYDLGTTRHERSLLAARIAEEPQLKQSSTRTLVSKLRRL